MFSSYKTIFITLFTLLLLVVFGAFVRVSLKLNTVRAEEAGDNLLIYFRHLIDREKANALFLSVALSDNKSLKDALIEGDEETGYRILIETLDKLKTYTFIKDVRTQIITRDLDIFARSWENESFAGMPLEGFRADLQRIRRVQKPKVSIDPGRLLTIKATTPFKNGAELIGYIEAIKTFDEITLYLRKKGIELLVLMDNAGTYSRTFQTWTWLALFIGFAIKIPAFPFHTWLPDAHVEAPTAISVILAGVLLKMGSYGFMRFNLPLFPQATQMYAPLLAFLAMVGIIYGALVALVRFRL